jgi:hypothetical protein
MKNRNGWRKRLHDNGLSIAFGAMFVVFLIAQTLTGHATYNQDQRDHRQPTIGYREYLFSPHSIEATAENWESEFLQMAMYVLLTVFLYQRGSAESKDPDKKEPVDREPSPWWADSEVVPEFAGPRIRNSVSRELRSTRSRRSS